MKIRDIVESFDTVVAKQVVSASPNGVYIKGRVGNRDIIYMAQISIGFEEESICTIEFYENDIAGKNPSYDKTGSGNEMQVFAFVLDCVKDTIIDYAPDEIQFAAVKADGNRGRLYKRLANRIPGYSLENVENGRATEIFHFIKDK